MARAGHEEGEAREDEDGLDHETPLKGSEIKIQHLGESEQVFEERFASREARREVRLRGSGSDGGEVGAVGLEEEAELDAVDCEGDEALY